MNTRQLFKQRVIELIHGLDYEEAIGIEMEMFSKNNDCMTGLSITLSRVMQALNNKDLSFSVDVRCDGLMIFAKKKVRQIYSCTWKLLKEDKSTADDDFQDDSVIEALYNLIK